VKESGRGPYRETMPGIRLQGLNETTEVLKQGSRYSDNETGNLQIQVRSYTTLTRFLDISSAERPLAYLRALY
jgi:hypothetical protein